MILHQILLDFHKFSDTSQNLHKLHSLKPIMSIPAKRFYVPEKWHALLEDKGWDNAQVAKICSLSEKQIGHILNGEGGKARRSTMKKLRETLLLQIGSEEFAKLFSDQEQS